MYLMQDLTKINVLDCDRWRANAIALIFVNWGVPFSRFNQSLNSFIDRNRPWHLTHEAT